MTGLSNEAKYKALVEGATEAILILFGYEVGYRNEARSNFDMTLHHAISSGVENAFSEVLPTDLTSTIKEAIKEMAKED